MGKSISHILNHSLTPECDFHSKVRQSTSTKRQTYCQLNSTFQRHPMYNNSKVLEYTRIAATRLRLSSHSLRVETGRWSRIERSRRVCACSDAVQDETHVLFHCPLSSHVQAKYPFSDIKTMAELFALDDTPLVARFCFEILKCYT